MCQMLPPALTCPFRDNRQQTSLTSQRHSLKLRPPVQGELACSASLMAISAPASAGHGALSAALETHHERAPLDLPPSHLFLVTRRFGGAAHHGCHHLSARRGSAVYRTLLLG